MSKVKSFEEIYKKGMINLIRMKRFRYAPLKIKKHLYKVIIRPMIEYPSTILYRIGKTNLKKLQTIQNRSLRFILNVKLKDKIKSSYIHKRLKMEPVNLRLRKLAKKMLYKAKSKYLQHEEEYQYTIYKLSDYSIEEPPLRTKRRSVAERINKYIYKTPDRKNVLHSLPKESLWQDPNPLY